MNKLGKPYYPSLNGWRGISVILVILLHIKYKYFPEVSETFSLFYDGKLGVNIFFVISGFLITSLIIYEEESSGNISLQNFYIRRIFRIFPAYYTLLIGYLILQKTGFISLSKESWITSLTYTKCFNIMNDWETGHLWSLSIEEQFYIIWPIVYKFFKKHRNKFVIFIIISTPIIRHFYYNTHNPWISQFTIFQRSDAMMWGCFLAIHYGKIFYFVNKVIKKYKFAIYIPFLIIPLLDIISKINVRYSLGLEFFTKSVGGTTCTLSSISIGLMLIVTINYSQNILYKILNSSVLNFLGKISYSVYLWQHIFLSRKLGFFSTLPYNIIFIFCAAILSYYFVEIPFLKLKNKFNKSQT